MRHELEKVSPNYPENQTANRATAITWEVVGVRWARV